MGIVFNNCDAAWSYGGFTRFKSRLPMRILLRPIFSKSDVNGEYTVEECESMLPILRLALAEWLTRQAPEDPGEAEEWEFDKYNLTELIKGMEWAVDNKQSLRYG